MGGWIAMEMAVRDTSRLSSLILVGPAGIAGAHVMAPMNFAEIPAAIEESGVIHKMRKAA